MFFCIIMDVYILHIWNICHIYIHGTSKCFRQGNICVLTWVFMSIDQLINTGLSITRIIFYNTKSSLMFFHHHINICWWLENLVTMTFRQPYIMKWYGISVIFIIPQSMWLWHCCWKVFTEIKQVLCMDAIQASLNNFKLGIMTAHFFIFC